MARFFITASNLFGGMAYLDKEDAEHIKVLRIRKGETYTVCDGNGTDYICKLSEEAEKGSSAVEIVDKVPSPGEPSIKCAVYAAFSKGDKMESVIQKSVEIGATEIVVFPSKRCVAKYEGSALVRKAERWQKIAKEAAKQSERGIIPAVTVLSSFSEAVKRAAGTDLPIFCYEEEKSLSLKNLLEQAENVGSVSIFTGPEGGFEPSEVQEAIDAGMKSVTLGPRILRCETAPICALAAVMLFTGNM